MPELPEVEIIRLGLQDKIVSLKISDIKINLPKIFQGNVKDIIGSKVINLRRRAKILLIDLDNDLSLVIHLKMSGQLVYSPSTSSGQVTFGHPIPFAGTTLPAKSTHVIFYFSDGSVLYFNDIRQFGYIKVLKTSEVEKLKAIGEFGPEPLTPEFTPEKFKEIILKKKMPVKLVLMDQTQIAGVGNIYANEALFLSKIHPERKANTLTGEEIQKLYDALLEVLKLGIKYGGSSENAYVNALGEKGTMQEHFLVYSKVGKPCPNKCGGLVKRIALGSRGTFFCPKCQK